MMLAVRPFSQCSLQQERTKPRSTFPAGLTKRTALEPAGSVDTQETLDYTSRFVHR